jgi:hypothetical protein
VISSNKTRSKRQGENLDLEVICLLLKSMTLSFLGETKGMGKNFRQLSLGDEEGKSAVKSEPGTEEQSWLGPYPVMKALPTFEDLTFRKLRCPVLLDQPLIV